MARGKPRQGTSLIDVLISLGIIAFLFWGIYLIYFSLIDSVSNIGARTAAVEMLNQQIEMIRNLPYDSVGTVSGVPSGVIPQQQTISIGSYSFVVNTTVRNIDDPFDGVLGGNPNDTTPADYKLVELQVSCPSCPRFVPLTFTTTVAPKSLEATGSVGSLFVNVFDANGIGIPSVAVHVSNASVTPAINLTDTTNASGVLQLVGVPTSTSYHVDVSKSGYSSDRTYPMGAFGASTPVNLDATVATGTVTAMSFPVDRVSALTVSASDAVCSPVASISFTFSGQKAVAVNPTVLKFSTSSITNASGSSIFPNLEWDTYTFLLNSSSYDLAGTIPFSPMIVNPSSTVGFRFVLKPAAPNSLMITVKDAVSGGAIPSSTVAISRIGFFQTLMTGHSFVTHNDWSPIGSYTSQSGGIDTSTPGTIKLLANASSTYSTSTVSWLISKTIDVGASSSSYYALNWTPASQPPQTGPGSAKFQLAANNDQVTWNFVGPDGTTGSYYTASSTVSGFNNNRYARYKVFLSTQDQNFTPAIQSVSLEFNSVCVPPSQVLFSNLSAAAYLVDVTAPQYREATTSVSVSGGWQSVQMPLTRQ